MVYNAWVNWLSPRTWQAAGLTLLWGGNVAYARGMDMLNLSHLWTLGIEEQFYLVWPLALILLLRQRQFVLPVGIVAVCAGWYFYVHTTTNLWTLALPEPAIVGLLLGALLGWAMHRGFSYGRWAAVLAVPALLYLLAVYFVVPTAGAWFNGTGIYLLELATAVLIVASLESGVVASLFKLSPLRWVGRISYSLYLWHYLVLGIVITLWPSDQGLPLAFVGVAASFAVATVSYYCVERPFVRIGHRQRVRGDRPASAPVTTSVGAIATSGVASVSIGDSSEVVGPTSS